MLSVDPILERTFFRSGAETLLVGRGGLETVLALAGALAVVFLASAVEVEVEVVVGLVAAGLVLGRLVAAPGKGGALEVVVEGVVALLFAAFPVALFGRLESATIITAIVGGKGEKDGSEAIYTSSSKSQRCTVASSTNNPKRGFSIDGNGTNLPDGDFAEVFLASAGLASVLIAAQHKPGRLVFHSRSRFAQKRSLGAQHSSSWSSGALCSSTHTDGPLHPQPPFPSLKGASQE